MKTQTKKSFMTRKQILQLLSPEEIAKVSMAESRRPADGEEYVDLAHPENGVLQVHSDGQIHWENVLPRSAVKDQTWAAILARVGTN